MKFAITFILVLLFSQQSQAQWPWWIGGRHSSTVEEGAQRGRAALWAGQGLFLKNLGDYEVSRQYAFGQYLDNRWKALKYRWQARDEYNRRTKSGPTWLEREHKKLDNAVALHELKKRKEELAAAGIIKPQTKGYMIYKGVKFDSYDDFVGSKEYFQMKEEQQRQKILDAQEKEWEEARDKLGSKFLAWADQLDIGESQAMNGRLWQTFIQSSNIENAKKRAAQKFYRTRPYLRPRAGKNGLPPLP